MWEVVEGLYVCDFYRGYVLMKKDMDEEDFILWVCFNIYYRSWFYWVLIG